MTATAVAERDNQNIAVERQEPTATSIMAMISEAVRAGLPMETIRELREMAKEEAREIAERAFNAAMGAAQAEIRPIAADAANPQTRSRYATYAKLDTALRPIYTKHGFAISYDTGDGAPDGFIRVLAYVTHSAGFARTYRADMPADGKGAKGNDVMTKTHATGAAMSYGMRYLLKMIFNVAVGEDDRDGNTADTGEVVSDEQLAKLRELIAETGSDIAKFCRYFKIEALPELRAAHYQRAIDSLNAKKKGATNA